MKLPFKKILSCLLMVCGAASAHGQGRIMEFDTPKLTVFLPNRHVATGKAVVVCPGGGYTHLAKDHEGFDWAPMFNDLGMACAVLQYKLPAGDNTIPMADVDAAFKLLADSASVWGINPEAIGIMGSSAGGHLASTAATHPTQNCRPAFQILLYPVISMQDDITHMGSQRGLLGEKPSAELKNEFSSDMRVTSSTPQAFITLSADDKAVPPANSINYFTALQKEGIPVSMFIYPTGGHGWGYRTNFKYHDNMVNELTTWIKNL